MSGRDTPSAAPRDSFVSGQNSEGVEFRGTLLRINRLAAVFEMYNPSAVLRFSEALGEFKVTLSDRALYAGKAVVRNLMNTNPSVVVCEVTLNENSWSSLDVTTLNGHPGKWQERYGVFLAEWEKCYRILPEFKTVMADMQIYLRDLQLWLNQQEVSLAASPPTRAVQDGNLISELSAPVSRAIDVFVDQVESMAAKLDEEQAAMHRAYLRRLLHPYLLCSPFAHRAYHKPLGYAGDYEMVGMMLRPPFEGGTLFAKLLNVWLLGQSPATAHRNRIDYLVRQLTHFALPMVGRGPKPRILTIGCGPAQEIQRFIAEQHISSHADFTLLDFNDETLSYTAAIMAGLKAKHNRATDFQYIKKSVHHLLKEGGRSVELPASARYDFVYCAGLFDYLSNQVCKRLMNAFYDMLSPGGLLVATNVSDVMNPARPFRYSMEYMLDWHLIYRDGQGMAKLAPDAAAADDVTVTTEDIGVNVFIEVRKPAHA